MSYKKFLYNGIKIICIVFILSVDINYCVNLIISNKYVILKSVKYNINLMIKMKPILSFVEGLYQLYTYIPFITSCVKKYIKIN